MNNKVIGVLFFVAAFWLGRPDSSLPIPGVKRSPVPGNGFHVLIVEDRPKRESLPPAQRSAMMSVTADKLLQSYGGKKYLYDHNQDVAKKDKWVQDAMQVKRDSLPWVIIDNDGYGTSEPMSADLQGYTDLLDKFGK